MMNRLTILTILSGALLWALPLSAFGQVDDNTPLQGKWTLETASVLKISGSDTLTVNVDLVKNDLAFALYDTLIFEDNMLTIPVQNLLDKGEYSMVENKIVFNFMPVAYILEFLIQDEKLYLTQRIFLSHLCTDCTYLVETIYQKVDL